jgi:hypothetical protein
MWNVRGGPGFIRPLNCFSPKSGNIVKVLAISYCQTMICGMHNQLSEKEREMAPRSGWIACSEVGKLCLGRCKAERLDKVS